MRRLFLLMSVVGLMGRAFILWLRIRPIIPPARWLLQIRPVLQEYWREINQIRENAKL